MHNSNGDFYEGHWHRGFCHGKGISRSVSGSRFEGEFKDGKMEGEGSVYISETETESKGEYHNGDLNGLGCRYYKDDSFYQGDFVNDKRHGLGVHFLSRR